MANDYARHDVIEIAERVIDDVVATMKGDIEVRVVYARVRGLFTRNHQGAWFDKHFSKSGWEVMIIIRLIHHDYRSYANDHNRFYPAPVGARK